MAFFAYHPASPLERDGFCLSALLVADDGWSIISNWIHGPHYNLLFSLLDFTEHKFLTRLVLPSPKTPEHSLSFSVKIKIRKRGCYFYSRLSSRFSCLFCFDSEVKCSLSWVFCGTNPLFIFFSIKILHCWQCIMSRFFVLLF